METRAAYWEPRIKTYGFQRAANLFLFEMTVPTARIDTLGRAFCRLGDAGVGFDLVFSRPCSKGLEIFLLVAAERAKVIETHLQELIEGTEKVVRRISPAEMVFFQGPHFGDRCGIFNTALRALDVRGIHIAATACSGSCIYIVLPEGQSEEAVVALSEVFDIPRASSHKRSVPAG